MNILILTNEFPPHIYGGAGVHVDHLVREMDRCDGGRHRIQVLCSGDQREERCNRTVTGLGSLGGKDAINLRHPKITDRIIAVSRAMRENIQLEKYRPENIGIIRTKLPGEIELT